MKRFDCVQGSAEWLSLRSCIPTASEFDNIISPTFEIRKGQTPATYLSQKLAEIWLGGPLLSFGAWATDQGTILQDEAIPWFEFEYGCKVDRVGFITNDAGTVGCSPDGLLDAETGLEIKCLQPVHHVSVLLNGELPKDFSAQVHGSMYVTGFPKWKLCCYRRRFPPLIITVHRDEEIISKIDEAVVLFLDKLKRSMDYLIELNGGEPPRKPEQSPGKVKFSWESDPDDVPH